MEMKLLQKVAIQTAKRPALQPWASTQLITAAVLNFATTRTNPSHR